MSDSLNDSNTKIFQPTARFEYNQEEEKFLADNFDHVDDAINSVKAIVRIAKSMNISLEEENEIDYHFLKFKIAASQAEMHNKAPAQH